MKLEVRYDNSCVHTPRSILTGLVIFFEGNEFIFSVSAQSQVPHSLSSAQIFGPLGAQHRIHLLRDLRCVRLVLDIDDGGYWAIVRHRSRMEHFVKLINEYAEDENKKSYLNQLTVCIARNGRNYPFDPLIAKGTLVDLHPIKSVKVSGVPEWFVKCLEMGVRGEGGDVVWYKWPPDSSKSAIEKWREPTLYWMELAAKNGIELPDDVERLFMVES
jgi:hypothetical protein